VIFAMEKGKIVSNKLNPVKPVAEQEKRRRLTWSAYNPPIMAVPFNYYSSRKWNKFDTKYVSGLFNGILALDRMVWLSQDGNSEVQVGELTESSLGEVRAMRFGLIGTFNFKRPWVYTFFVTNNTFDRDFSDSVSKLTLYDLRLDIPLPANITLSVGKQKEPISMSRLTTLVFLPMQERQAAEDAFLPARNYGVVFNSTYLIGRGTWAAGVFKNWIESDTTFQDTPLQVTGRVTGLPYVTEDESNLIHLGLSLRYSDARQPVVGKTESEFYLSPVYVATS
jgi:phosphate-selective porin OprO/OprP